MHSDSHIDTGPGVECSCKIYIQQAQQEQLSYLSARLLMKFVAGLTHMHRDNIAVIMDSVDRCYAMHHSWHVEAYGRLQKAIT